jgi:hypothetical protein
MHRIMLTTNNQQHTNNIVSSSSADELLLHGIRIKGKSVVVELSDSYEDLQPDQLHVGSLNDAQGMRLLNEIDSSERKEFTARIWHSLAQALKYFSLENSCTIDLSTDSIYVNQEFTKVYLTKWTRSKDKEIESAGSIEQVYITQLSRLYAFLISGNDLDATSKKLENSNWDNNNLKHQLDSMKIDTELRETFFKGLQIDDNMFIGIDALVSSVKPYLHTSNPKGFLPFIASVWIAFSMQATITMAILIELYAHTLV